MKRLNNKGYMLVEIILAFALAMAITYFITDLTIKLKNKNDDLLVKTLVATDQAIIYNTLMKEVYYSEYPFRCSDIQINGQKFTYKGFTNIVSKYAKISQPICNESDTQIDVTIPISVEQLPDENYDVVIKIKKTV